MYLNRYKTDKLILQFILFNQFLEGVKLVKEKKIFKQAKLLQKSIVFPEASFSDRTIEAVKYIQKKSIAKPILIGDESALILRDKTLADFQIISPKTFQAKDELVKHLYQKRKEKGLTLQEAEELVQDPYYFATLLVEMGYADGMVAGAEETTARTIRPAFQIIKARKKNGIISSSFLVYGENKFLNDRAILLADCAINKHPNEDELFQIACQSVETYLSLGLKDPKVAFLSFSTNGSADDETVRIVKAAAEKFRKKGYVCDGDIQFDAAINENVAKIKCPQSPLKGDANILIFPDLNSGNISYKAIEYIGGLNAVGPILQGLNKPVNDLSRGCSVEDIVLLTAITVLQTIKEEK